MLSNVAHGTRLFLFMYYRYLLGYLLTYHSTADEKFSNALTFPDSGKKGGAGPKKHTLKAAGRKTALELLLLVTEFLYTPNNYTPDIYLHQTGTRVSISLGSLQSGGLSRNVQARSAPEVQSLSQIHHRFILRCEQGRRWALIGSGSSWLPSPAHFSSQGVKQVPPPVTNAITAFKQLLLGTY